MHGFFPIILLLITKTRSEMLDESKVDDQVEDNSVFYQKNAASKY